MDPFLESMVRVPLQEIDWDDRTFEIRRLAPADGLDESLNCCGLLSPPWLLRRQSGPHTIVDGFKRLHWLRESGAEAAACFVFPVDSTFESLWLRRLTLKAFGPPLNVAEKAQMAERILDFVPDERDRRRLLTPLGIPSRTEVLAKWRELSVGDANLLCAAARGEIGERAALQLASWLDEPAARRELVELLTRLRCSASIQLEIIERVFEIAQAGDRSRLEVLRMPEIASLSTHPKWSPREKTQALRDLLTRLRYPRLRAREEAFQKHLAALSLPKTMRISPPPSFEGDAYRLQIDFSAPEELRGCDEAVRSLASDPRLQTLLRPTRPEKG